MFAGPFTAGCPGSNSAATRDLHRLLTAEAARGRLWDPKKSGEENRQIPFSATSAQLQQLEVADVGTKAPEIQTPKGDQQVNSQCMFFCNPFCRVGCHVAR